MKLVTFATANGAEYLGALTDGGIVDLAAAARASGRMTSALTDAIAFLEAGSAARDAALFLVEWSLVRRDPATLIDPGAVRLRAPVPRPPKILCLAGNYADHWRESGLAAPPKANRTPDVFSKPVTTVVASGEPVRLPGPICTAVDYEGELAVVIGRPGRNIPESRALDHVAGCTNYNDISGRQLTLPVQREPNPRTAYFDWLIGKWFDSFGPFGPFLAIDEVADPQDLRIRTRVNGETRQDGWTGDMIFSVAETISWISRFVTLQAGDLIATGTPTGVGATTATYLRPGDVVEVEVDGLGILSNVVAA